MPFCVFCHLLLCPSSFNQTNGLSKRGKWHFEWQDPVAASVLTLAGGKKKKSRGLGESFFH